LNLTIRLRTTTFFLLAIVSLAFSGSKIQQWPWYAGDPAGTHYSPLADINRGNVAKLQLVWEWKTGEKPMPDKHIAPGMFETTPLMIDGVLYLTTPYNRVIALDSETGQQRWTYDPKATELEDQVLNGVGYVHRGLAAWRDNSKLRLFMVSHYSLICLDAESGQPVSSFGDNGVVDLSQGLVWDINKKHVTNTSPPVVYKNLVILSNSIADRLVYKNDPPGDIRAYDTRTGKRVWSFHTIPQNGEFGNDTWENTSWKFTGHTNAWAPITLDERRGLVYFAIGTPSNDFYGGHRLGNDLFAESVLCLDASTGLRKWHYQLVHHGLWDYDLPTPPDLVTLHINGRSIDAAVQLTKMGYVFMFDRVTGKPIWPIEERSVPASDVPGERASPTQPVPVRPPAITPQGVSLDDAFDLTPELKQEALTEMKKYRLGPLYTPPSFGGTLMRPSIIGGANWGGGAFDPETGMLYVKTTNLPSIARLRRPDKSATNPQAADVDADYVQEFATNAQFHNGLPLLKPPYGLLTAVNLNKAEIAWQVPFGDTPGLRNHPALAGAALPAQLGAAGVQGGIVTAGGLILIGGGDSSFHAVDKTTGKDLWTYPLGRRTTGTPATYRTSSGRQFVVIATGTGSQATLVAFALPN
jgi:quinoprotein glucose dehydrogenase